MRTLPLVRTVTAAAAVATAAVLLAPGIAHAESTSVLDPGNDVWESDRATLMSTPAGGVTNTDLRKVRLEHARSRVRVTATYADLSKEFTYFSFNVFLETNKRNFIAQVEVPTNKTSGKSALTNVASERLDCQGLDHQVNYAKEQITLSIPRSCMKRPKTVRVQASSISGETKSSELLYTDALGNDQLMPTVWSKRVKRG